MTSHGSLTNIGALRQEVQVKLFGGADVLPLSAAGPLRPTVGKQNCEAAIEVLRDEGFQGDRIKPGRELRPKHSVLHRDR